MGCQRVRGGGGGVGRGGGSWRGKWSLFAYDASWYSYINVLNISYRKSPKTPGYTLLGTHPAVLDTLTDSKIDLFDF